jgi:hypothetical protein
LFKSDLVRSMDGLPRHRTGHPLPTPHLTIAFRGAIESKKIGTARLFASGQIHCA